MKLVVTGGVSPVEVDLPAPRPDPTMRSAFESVRTKITREGTRGPAHLAKPYLLTAPEVAVLFKALALFEFHHFLGRKL